MKKIKEYHICDRCKKEITDEEINEVFDYAYRYELCNECKDVHDEFIRKVNGLKKTWEHLEEKYKFGEYLPKEKVN